MSWPRTVIRRAGRWTLALPVAGMAFLFFLSSIPGGEHEVLGYAFEIAPELGNFLHIPAYYVLALLWKIALEAWAAPEHKTSALAIIFTTVFGALDEYHQSFVPNRFMDARDVVVNFFGAVLTVLTWRFVRPIFFSERRPESPEKHPAG
ncbi:MAG TPA: VanZ family protein [Planctomycetota bacterium]|nr:VanZ family protein [Planctomycetota bacterium]